MIKEEHNDFNDSLEYDYEDNRYLYLVVYRIFCIKKS